MRGAVLLLALAAGCGGGEERSAKKDASPEASPATPVRMAAVERADLAELVSAPGKITAMSQAKIRAPFAGTLVDLRVTDGDMVRKGEVVGSVVSRDSEAALSGAREMEREAKTPAERRDAARAVELSRKNLVGSPLTAAGSGVVASHAASRGDRVSEGEEILSIAESGSLVVLSDVPQPQLAHIRAGEAARIELAGRPSLEGRVHDVLPAGAASDFTAPVRIDLTAVPPGISAGLFVTARIVVAEHRQAIVVPDAAVLRDDVTGVARIAMAGSDGKAHWIMVTPGLSQNGKTEIAAPVLEPGRKVIVAGQVGLPEGAAVIVAP